jgi:glycosyltransferase involved in cell wall biosynthesis
MIDVEAVPVREHDDGPEVVLGWIGSRTTAPYLHRIAADLDEFAAGDPGRVRLVVVGGDAPRLRNAHVEQIRWSPDAERATLKRMDVGLMPLPDNEWTRGKCAYKALQYMAAGVPVIADDVGVSAAVVGDEVGGFVVPRGASWVAPLRELARDPALRGRMGASARRRIAEEYSTLRWLPELARLLRSA